MGERYDDLKGVGLTELHASQMLWADEQAAWLEDYFRSQGKNETIEREWPIVRLLARQAARLPRSSGCSRSISRLSMSLPGDQPGPRNA